MDPTWDSGSFPVGTLECLLCKKSLGYENDDRTELIDHLYNDHQTKIHQNLILAITFLDNKTLNNIIDQFEKNSKSVYNDETLLEEFDSDQDTIEVIEKNGHEKENEIEERLDEEETDCNEFEYEDIKSGQDKERQDKENELEERLDEEETDCNAMEYEDIKNGQDKENELEERLDEEQTDYNAMKYQDIKNDHEKENELEEKFDEKETDCNAMEYEEIIKSSEYFKKNPKQMTTKCNPDLHFGDDFPLVDPNIPSSGWKMRNHKTPSGNVEEHYLAPDGRVIKSKIAVIEYIKVIEKHSMKKIITPSNLLKPKGRKRQRPKKLGTDLLQRRVISKEESEDIVEVKRESEEIAEVKRELDEILEVKTDSEEIVEISKPSKPSGLNQKKLSGVAFNCEDCKYKTTRKSDFQEHLKSIHKLIMFSCERCDYMTTREIDFQKHYKSVHEKVKLNTEKSDNKATNRGNLLQRTKFVQKGEKFNCEQCNYKSIFKSYLQQHIKSVHEGVTFDCEQCEHKANNQGNLQRHIKSVHVPS